MIKDVEFTDKQGQHFPAAVFKVFSATRKYNTNNVGIITLDLNMSKVTDILQENREIASSGSHEVRVVYAYWRDWETYSSDGSFYWLTRWEPTQDGLIDAGTEWLINNSELSKPEYTGLSLEETCDYYLENIILSYRV